MSKLIDELVATEYPGKSARDLTLEYGDYLQQNKRDDIFASNPDFAQEYAKIKDDVARARRPGFVDEFTGAFGSAVDDLQATGFALGALAAHGAEKIGIPGAAPVRNNLLELMKEQQEEAQSFQPSVPSYQNISGEHPIEDTARYATYGLGTVAPSMVQAAAAGLVGAGLGAAAGTAIEPGGGTVVGGIGGALFGLAERRLAQKAVSKLLEQGVRDVTLDMAAKAIPREIIAAEAKKLAIQYGSNLALAASSIGSEVGSIYADNPDAPGAALAFGIPAGLLDVIPESYVLSKFFKPGKAVTEAASKNATGYFRRFVEEAFKTVPMEGSTEAAQTLLEIAAKKYSAGESPTSFTNDDYKQALNAGIIGAIGGIAMAPIAAGPRGSHVDPQDAAAADLAARYRAFDTTIPEASPLAPDVSSTPQFAGTIPEAELTSPRTMGPSSQVALEDAAPTTGESFTDQEANPYKLGAAPPIIEAPKYVQSAVDSVDEAARAWEIKHSSQAETGFGVDTAPAPAGPLEFGDTPLQPQEREQVEAPASAQITDAPLANLIGTTVQYQGYAGTLVRDPTGNFMVLPPTAEGSKPLWIEVEGSAKDPTMLASAVGIVPTEPANMTPKAPGATAVPQVGGRAPGELSKVPLGDLFPSDLVPRADLNPQVATQPGTVAALNPASESTISAPAANLPAGAAPVPFGAESAPVAPAIPASVASIPGVIPTAPTVEQTVQRSGNGVESIPPRDIPNLRRLRIFEQPKSAPVTEDELGPLPEAARAAPTLESQSIAENPFVALDKAVGKLGKSDSNVAVVLVDNATGQAYMRTAYRGADNTLYVDQSSTRKGTATGQGSTVSAEADLQRGTEGRPARKLFAEKLTGGEPRYSVYGVGELTSPKGPRNWNIGSNEELLTHPGLNEAAKRYWNEAAKARPESRAKMPAASVDIESFAADMATWRRDNPGKVNAEAMAARIAEFVAAQNKAAGQRVDPKVLAAWAENLRENIQQMSEVQQKQAVLISGDYLEAPSSTIELYRSTLRALTEGRQVDVAAFEQGFFNAFDKSTKAVGGGVDFTFGDKYSNSVKDFEELAGALDSGTSATLWYGGEGPNRSPLFTTTSESGASQYIINRGGGKLHKIDVGTRKPFIIRSDADLAKLASLLNEVGVNSKFSNGNWMTPSVRSFSSGYSGSNPLDIAYIPAAREALKQAGYDSILKLDSLGSRKIVALVLLDKITGVSSAQTTGLVISQEGRKKIVAYSIGSMNGPVNADTILPLLHEVGHVVTDGLSEPLRVAFQEAIEQLPHSQARWLMNPRSLDIRLLATADPAHLSPEQRAALQQLTAEEIAAARRMPPSALVEEKMAEHLAQLGWDKSEATSAVQRFIRFIKELWLNTALAIQKALKGPENVSPALARAYVENRFLQFIHRDSAFASDRINDLLNWIGVPPTERQLVPVLPAGSDWDQRMQYIDVATGQLIPVDHSTYTPEAQTLYLKTAIDNAARYIAENPGSADTPEVRQTRRAAFTAPMSFTPALQTNTVFAAVNLEEEIYQQIAANPDIGPLLPPGGDFARDWLRLPDGQIPSARRQQAETWAKAQQDPLTGKPIDYRADIRVNDLPAADEAIVDKEGQPVTVQLTEAQDKALQQTIASLGDTQRRVQARIAYETDRITDLERLRKRNPADFAESALRELDELKEAVPLRQKVADQLEIQKNALLAKFRPGDLVNIYPTAQYLTVPSGDATEAQIRSAPRGVVPRDLKFTDKTGFSGHLADMDSWLQKPENRAKGQIYGIISEQYRKLMQIPTDLQRAGTAGILRRSITGSFVDELRASGLPALQNLGKKFYETASIINAHNDEAKVEGDKWSTAFANFAKAVGSEPDQAFKEQAWDPLMRTWNFIDVSERNQLGTPGEANLFATMERALKTAAGIDVNSEPKRAALRALLMSTIENERQVRTVYEQNPGLKVRDDAMGVYRRLVSHGIVTGRRSVARHMSGLFMRMNPEWSDTAPIGTDDVRTFWEAAPDLYQRDRAKFDARMKELFPGYVVTDFVEPLVGNNTQIFDVTDADGITRKASLLRVRQAWSEAKGDVTKFAENLHALEGAKPGAEAQTVEHVLTAFQRMFNEIKSDQDSKNGTEATGQEILPRQMMDARLANDWPADWVSYATYTKADNLTLLHQLARSAAFGPDAIAASGELASTIRESRRDLDELYARYDDLWRNGKKDAEIKKLMGEDDFKIAKNAQKISANLDRVQQAFKTMSANTNYLSGDFKLMNEALGFASTMMVQNPRGGAINVIGDTLGPLVALKLSTPALKALATQIKTLAADLGNGVIQSFGQDSAFNTNLALRRMNAGVRDPDIRTTWREKINNYGPGQSLSTPNGPESLLDRGARVATRTFARARDILPNLGSPLQKSGDAQALSPKLRWGVFPNTAFSTMNANIDAAYTVFADLGQRGVGYLTKVPLKEREAFVRDLELGVRDIGADELGYFGGLILNDKAAFDSMKFALETKMAGESGVGRFVAKAYRTFQKAGDSEWSPISNSQFTDIINYANTEWTLQNNFASLPPWMQSGPLRPLFTFLTWPYNAMRRFGKTFTDPEGRLIWWGANSTVADGMKAFFLLAAPATIAGSFAIDWYDKYALGKRQNLRDTSLATALPGVGLFVDPKAFVERVGRYGSAGFASDVVNQILNFDSQHNLSLDNRIVAINAISSLIESLATNPIQQHGNLTYGSVGRPFLQSIGGGGVLQYLQIINNALGLNNQEAAINARINTGNYLRAAGKELNLPVRVFQGAAFAPTPVSPYLQQMELAALVNNPQLFREAYRNALAAARTDGPPSAQADPAKYVAENFADHHPLRRLFKSTPTETDYRRMLGKMDEYGAGQVRKAISSYNSFLGQYFGKKPYYGKPDKSAQSVDQLIRAATRINSGLENPANSALTIR